MKTEPATHEFEGAVPLLLAEIQEHPFLQGLSLKYLRLLADFAMKAHFDSGQLIFQEGDPANRFYLLSKGKVVLESDDGAKATQIQTIGANEVLGWSWLFPPYYWHFDARAIEPLMPYFFTERVFANYARKIMTSLMNS